MELVVIMLFMFSTQRLLLHLAIYACALVQPSKAFFDFQESPSCFTKQFPQKSDYSNNSLEISPDDVSEQAALDDIIINFDENMFDINLQTTPDVTISFDERPLLQQMIFRKKPCKKPHVPQIFFPFVSSDSVENVVEYLNERIRKKRS
jgi:hypothetical protein